MYKIIIEFIISKYMILKINNIKISNNYNNGCCFTLVKFLNNSINVKDKTIILINNICYYISNMK